MLVMIDKKKEGSSFVFNVVLQLLLSKQARAASSLMEKRRGLCWYLAYIFQCSDLTVDLEN